MSGSSPLVRPSPRLTIVVRWFMVGRCPFLNRSAASLKSLVTSTSIMLSLKIEGLYEKAPRPASATSWSWSTVPPLTPMAPAISPLRVSGMPPAKLTKRPCRIVSRP